MFGWFRRFPPGFRVILGFVSLILAGTILLLLPASTPADRTLTLTDALFTATSAVCVTGLIVVQTPLHFTWFGELVILCLFQAGGIGIVLGSTMLLMGIKGSMRIDQRFDLQENFINWPYRRVKSALKRVFLLFFGLEAAGAGILTWQFSRDMAMPRAVWHGVFHSVSAVCNAGFSLNPDSLVGYGDNPVVTLTVSTLIVFGGLGFVVIADLWDSLASGERLSLHTRTMLLGTVFLLLVGTGLFVLL